MSEPIPESIPTSADPRSKRPTKKRALSPKAALAADVEALFAKPDREITIPTSAPKKNLPPPPEIVANVQGSSAGAGSGEFHVYKASRRREYERLRLMDEEVKKEEAQREFEEKKKELERLDREKTERNRAKREKAKARKERMKKGGKGGVGEQNGTKDGQVKSKLGRNPGAAKSREGEDDTDAANAGGEVKVAEEPVGIVIHDDD
ncbi:DUF1168-domain-containing protein [Delitschia confertaspora ATCC 74209]|uniref:DUF1168-domain-containing protein n=1 Tax=Delitschia confertaspora ATCC 74209 TaxID=1513339 RepID=A0A9P4MR41_9PLEO|nr:DUF1168-domain-containing protein [Delitschia confertaspora ATCC 74209]